MLVSRTGAGSLRAWWLVERRCRQIATGGSLVGTLQTNGSNSVVSESILKPCGAKLDVTKPFFRLASRKQRSRHAKCPPQKVSLFSNTSSDIDTCSWFRYSLDNARYFV